MLVALATSGTGDKPRLYKTYNATARVPQKRTLWMCSTVLFSSLQYQQLRKSVWLLFRTQEDFKIQNPGVRDRGNGIGTTLFLPCIGLLE